jgi:hypothetical protein
MDTIVTHDVWIRALHNDSTELIELRRIRKNLKIQAENKSAAHE